MFIYLQISVLIKKKIGLLALLTRYTVNFIIQNTNSRLKQSPFQNMRVKTTTNDAEGLGEENIFKRNKTVFKRNYTSQ